MPVESNNLVLVEAATIMVPKDGDLRVTGEFPMRFVFDEKQDEQPFEGVTIFTNIDFERTLYALPVGGGQMTSGAYTVVHAIERTWPEGARVTYSIWKERDPS